MRTTWPGGTAPPGGSFERRLAEYPLADCFGFRPRSADQILNYVLKNRAMWEHLWAIWPERQVAWDARIERERALGRPPDYPRRLREQLEARRRDLANRPSDQSRPEEIEALRRDEIELAELTAEETRQIRLIGQHRQACGCGRLAEIWNG